jgi:hypothetical protein
MSERDDATDSICWNISKIKTRIFQDRKIKLLNELNFELKNKMNAHSP